MHVSHGVQLVLVQRQHKTLYVVILVPVHIIFYPLVAFAVLWILEIGTPRTGTWA
jgi:hypothetical protein